MSQTESLVGARVRCHEHPYDCYVEGEIVGVTDTHYSVRVDVDVHSGVAMPASARVGSVVTRTVKSAWSLLGPMHRRCFTEVI